MAMSRATAIPIHTFILNVSHSAEASTADDCRYQKTTQRIAARPSAAPARPTQIRWRPEAMGTLPVRTAATCQCSD
jgi:hypothetical protein